ncbi:hypothetical protein ARTSIC4J27_977 [Pseudarthrobacter siccitolerans]|uniref:Uncharacterized protein n=1 Tax=Pseudarthrobacter siccitolerans TaxID=861266 RepID=A0A024GYN0_9MICC|nr:hypothetical protein ARTSIC4J27_977 [Pseudarthrobacter siccitolerans]
MAVGRGVDLPHRRRGLRSARLGRTVMREAPAGGASRAQKA